MLRGDGDEVGGSGRGLTVVRRGTLWDDDVSIGAISFLFCGNRELGEKNIQTTIERVNSAYLSEPTMKISLFTARYLPLPHPTSRPTEPGSRPWRNFSMIGHGCEKRCHS